MQQLSIQEQMLLEQRLANNKKTLGVAFAFWFFLGIFGAHRFYLARTTSAIFQIVSVIFIVGLVWVLIDAFLISGMVKDEEDKLKMKLHKEMVVFRDDLSRAENSSPHTR